MASPELRRDPFSGRHVIIAPQRADRPETFAPQAASPADAFDPFAEGNEPATPPETLAIRSPGSIPDGPGWRVRVVPNQYPALADFADASAQPTRDNGEELRRSSPAVGVHEVVVECPGGETNLSRLPAEAIGEVLQVWRDRLRMLAADPRLAAGVIFKNSGADAGASIAHAHSQLMATTFVPDDLARELAAAEHYRSRTGRCLFEDVLEKELSDGQRVVQHTGGGVALCPFASRFPSEVWLVPRSHAPRFDACSNEDLADTAKLLKSVLRKLDRTLSEPALNLVLHTAPFGANEPRGYHWHLEIYPRTTRPGGYEWGAGVCINPLTPEQAAARLRDA